MPQPLLFRLIDKAVFEYNMIENGDRILVGASGGKDSTALVEYFATRSRRPSCGFGFTAIHIRTEITPPFTSDQTELFRSWNVEPVTLEAGILSRLKAGRKMNCWWCATQRRTELLEYAISHNYNKLALGHHLDDILETLLMNMLYKGELSTMPPRLRYDKYPVTVIRPLCFVPVELVKKHAEECGYMSTTCSCTYQDNSGRKEARRRLTALTDGDLTKKERLFAALRNIDREYLP